MSLAKEIPKAVDEPVVDAVPSKQPSAGKPKTLDDAVVPASAKSLSVAVMSLVIALIGTAFTVGLGGHNPDAWVHDLIDSLSRSLLDSPVCKAFPSVCGVLVGVSHLDMMQEHYQGEFDVQILDRPAHDPENPVLNLDFYNRLPFNVAVAWKDYEGKEQPWFVMDAYSYHGNITSVRGHVWTFRLAKTHQVLFEELIDSQHCGKIMIAPPEHLEALRLMCRQTGRAVLGHWPRAPVVRQMLQLSPVGHVREFTSEHAHFVDERSQDAVTSFRVRTLSTAPHLLEIENFLSDEECEHLKEAALASGALDDAKDVVDGDVPSMSGQSVWLEHSQSPIVSTIIRRLFDLMGFEEDVETFYFAERMQVSRFRAGEQYSPHFDAMDMTTTQREIPHNRFATLMMFLNDVKKGDGGEEVFPRANFADEFDRPACDAALQVQPKKGKLVVLYSMQKDGNIDETSLHGSCPMADGAEKWTSSLFLWDPFVQWK